MANKRTNRMGDSPIFETFDADQERKSLGIELPETKKGKPRNDKLVKGNTVQAGLPADWTRACFIVRCDYLRKLKVFAFTERLSLKEALDLVLGEYLSDIDDDELMYDEYDEKRGGNA